MAIDWRVYGADTIAYRLDRSDLPGWIRKKVVVGPGEGALIVRDGRPEEMLTQASANVQGLLDGVVSKLLGWITGSADVQVIFLDLGPVRVPAYLGESRIQERAAATTVTPEGWLKNSRATDVGIQAITSDKQVISAECITTLRVNPANPMRIASMLKGSKALSRWDLASHVRDEVLARVLIPQLAKVNAADVRGNTSLASQIASWVRAELEPTLSSAGLILDNFVINWGLTDAEKHDVAERRSGLEEESRKFVHGRRLAELQRELETDRTRLDNLHQLTLAETSNDDTLKDLYLAGEVRRNAIRDGQRVAVAKVDAEVRLTRLDLEKKEGELRLEQHRVEQLLRLDLDGRQFALDQQKRLAQVDADDKEMRGMVIMQIQMATAKHDRRVSERRMEIDAEFARMRAEMDTRLQERRIRLEEDRARMEQIQSILAQGLTSGIATGETLSAFLSESTRQSYGTATDGKANAFFASEAAKNNLTTFQHAEDRERRYQQDMTRLSADLMQASKQPASPTVITGGGSYTPPPTTVNVVNPVAPPADEKRVRLKRLKEYFESGLIDETEYRERKTAVLDEA